jgi:hypothetical protein
MWTTNVSWLNRARAFVAVWMAFCAAAHAQSSDLLDVTHTIAGPNRAVPVEHDFTISTAGTYKVTLTDLGAALTPSAPLASVKLAITNGASIVGTPLTATPPLTGGAESGQFTATPGTYRVHVIGVPGSVAGSGPIGIQITNTADGSTVDNYSATLALPAGALPNNEAVISDSFSVTKTGTYQVTLTDFQMPQPLPTLTLAITQQGGSLMTTLGAAGTASVTLNAGVTYQIFAIGQASTTLNAGLFSAVVTGAAPGYNKTVPVGSAASLGTITLAAGSYTLNLTDLIYPTAPLGQLGAVVTLNGAAVAQLNAAGSKSFTATANTYQVFALGVPATPPGTGSYAVTVQPPSGAAALSVAQAVATPGGTLSAYTFNTNITSAGTYTADIADFKFAAAFASLSAAVVQGNNTLGTIANAAGAADTPASVPAVTGPLSILVFAQPGTSGSLFGVDLVASGASSPLFQANQGVGELFGTEQVTVTTAGQYSVTVNDVSFPTALTGLNVIATQGITRLGTVYSGGAFSFSATPGNYVINVIAQPGGTDDAGTYALSVGPTPPAPTVTLTSSANSVTSGGTVTLTWSSQGATSCSSAGGSFTGSQSLTGSVTTAAITSATTFSLTCVGAGGSTTQSVTVNVTGTSPAGGGGKSGGGAIGLLTVLALGTVLLLKAGGDLRRPRRA